MDYSYSDFHHDRLVWPFFCLFSLFWLYINGMILGVVFCVWLPLADVVCNGSSFIFTAIKYSIWTISQPFIRPLICRQLYCMEATKHWDCYKCYEHLYTHFHFMYTFIWDIPRSDIFVVIIHIYPNLLNNVKQFFIIILPMYITSISVWEIWFLTNNWHKPYSDHFSLSSL